MVYHNLLAGSDRFLPWAPVIESLDVNFLPTRKNSLSDEASKTVVVKYCRLLNEVEKSISFLEKKWQKICNSFKPWTVGEPFKLDGQILGLSLPIGLLEGPRFWHSIYWHIDIGESVMEF